MPGFSYALTLLNITHAHLSLEHFFYLLTCEEIQRVARLKPGERAVLRPGTLDVMTVVREPRESTRANQLRP